MKLYFAQTSLGKIGIAEQNNSIVRLYFPADVIPTEIEIIETTLLSEAVSQLNAYLAGELQQFSLPLAPRGTEFMQTVWKALCAVPYGKTASYKEIATVIGNPKAVRAVGLANNKNPLPIFIPCHRIIGSNGKLVGYAGGLAMKQFLLDLENTQHAKK
jgi:methylated-DNA-[protein]-cysteine S-methyltransferase